MHAIRHHLWIIAAAVALSMSAQTRAATITITDLTEGPPTVEFSGFPTFSSTSNCSSSTDEVLSCRLVFSGPDGGESNVVDTSIVLYEDSALTLVSDYARFTQTISSGSEVLEIQFQSQDGLSISGDQIAMETGAAQLFNLPTLCNGCLDITVSLTSDVEPAPAPATLALLGIGLAGLGFSRRKRVS